MIVSYGGRNQGKTMLMTITQVTSTRNVKEINALVKDPSKLQSEPWKYYLNAEKDKLIIHFKRKNCYFSKTYKVSINDNILSI